MRLAGQAGVVAAGSAVLVGRQPELDRVDGFLDGADPFLLIVGEAGIGKSVLWRAAAALARERGWRVLSAQPAQPESHLSFAALGDLLVDVVTEVGSAIPAPQRRALEAALLLGPHEGPVPDQRGVALATLAALRAAATETPIVVGIDDSQWLDRPSSAALEFALRRLPADRVRAIVTWRTEQPAHTTPLGLDVDRTLRVGLGPLSFGATHRLLTTAHRADVSYPLARRLHEAAHGNPLHVLELARALERRRPWTPDTFAPPPDLAELVRARLAALPPSTRRTLLFIAAMARPTRDLLQLTGASDDPSADVDGAVDAGMLVVDGTRLRFAHPLFASACYRATPLAERRAVHARLAEVAVDPEARARNLALAATRPRSELAAAVEMGARHAARRGAPYAAAELVDLARALTPEQDMADLDRRTRELAHHQLEAGEPGAARRTLEEHLAAQPPGPRRVPALVALSAVLFEEDGVAAMRSLAAQAIEEAGDEPSAAAEAHIAMSERSEIPAPQALHHAEAAMSILERHSEVRPDLMCLAVREVALGRYHMGRGMARDMIARASALEAALPIRQPVAWRARTCMGECLKYLDCFDEAEAILGESELIAEREGDVSSQVDLAGHRCELALWQGRWADAEAFAEKAVQMAHLIEARGRIAIATYFLSLVRAHQGQVDQARDHAMTALGHAEGADEEWAAVLARLALGFLDLSIGDARGAAGHLSGCDAYASRGIFSVPRQHRHLGDYVEALVGCGELDLAADRLAALASWAAQMGTGWSRATCARATGLLHEARGDRDLASDAFAEALRVLEAMPLPFERARTLMALGSLHRRAGRRRAARDSLGTALDLFTALGARLWAERATRELAGIGGRTRTAVELTVSEARVAELVAAGMTNKQAAAALVVTPRTVEAHLTRVYAKLGVRSRVELAARFARGASSHIL